MKQFYRLKTKDGVLGEMKEVEGELRHYIELAIKKSIGLECETDMSVPFESRKYQLNKGHSILWEYEEI